MKLATMLFLAGFLAGCRTESSETDSLAAGGEGKFERTISQSTDRQRMRVVDQPKSEFAAESSGYRVYWGDVHGHTVISDGKGSLDDYFTHARIPLDFRINGQVMGEEIEIKGQPQIRLEVKGNDRIEEVIIVRDGAVVRSIFPTSRDVRFAWVDPLFVGASYFYARVVQAGWGIILTGGRARSGSTRSVNRHSPRRGCALIWAEKFFNFRLPFRLEMVNFNPSVR